MEEGFWEEPWRRLMFQQMEMEQKSILAMG